MDVRTYRILDADGEEYYLEISISMNPPHLQMRKIQVVFI